MAAPAWVAAALAVRPLLPALADLRRFRAPDAAAPIGTAVSVLTPCWPAGRVARAALRHGIRRAQA